MAPDFSAVEVVNRGKEVACGVIVRDTGNEEDWADVLSAGTALSHLNVRPYDSTTLAHDRYEDAPARVWIWWDGVTEPVAVEVDPSTGSKGGRVWALEPRVAAFGDGGPPAKACVCTLAALQSTTRLAPIWHGAQKVEGKVEAAGR